MRAGRRRTRALLCLAAAAAAPAVAAPTGLNMIPTADVLARGVASFEVEHLGAGVLPGARGETLAFSQAGLTSRLEAGVDRRIGGGPGHTFLNAKWQVTPEAGRLPAVAVGVQNVAGGHHAHPYLVGTRTLGRTRFHLGALHTPGAIRTLAGIDHTLGTVALQADLIGGRRAAPPPA